MYQVTCSPSSSRRTFAGSAPSVGPAVIPVGASAPKGAGPSNDDEPMIYIDIHIDKHKCIYRWNTASGQLNVCVRSPAMNRAAAGPSRDPPLPPAQQQHRWGPQRRRAPGPRMTKLKRRAPSRALTIVIYTYMLTHLHVHQTAADRFHDIHRCIHRYKHKYIYW